MASVRIAPRILRCSNCMTSNAGSDLIMEHCANPDDEPSPSELSEMLHTELQKSFKPAFLGRVTLIPYKPLSDDIMHQIIKLQLGRVEQRVYNNHRAVFEIVRPVPPVAF